MIKKINLLILMIVFHLIIFTTLVCSQGIHDKGIKLGVNLGSIKGDDTEQYQNQNKNYRIGFIGGVFFTYQINQIFSIQPELFYSMQGVQYSFSKSQKGNSIVYQQDYISAPLLLKFNLNPSNQLLKANILLGPCVSFLVNSQFKDGSTSIDIMDETNNIDLALVFGSELVYSKFIIDVRYKLGLSNVLTNTDDWKNSVLTFILGILL